MKRRGGKRLIVLITAHIKINSSQSQVVVWKATVAVPQEWIRWGLLTAAMAPQSRSHLNANSHKGQLD